MCTIISSLINPSFSFYFIFFSKCNAKIRCRALQLISLTIVHTSKAILLSFSLSFLFFSLLFTSLFVCIYACRCVCRWLLFYFSRLFFKNRLWLLPSSQSKLNWAFRGVTAIFLSRLRYFNIPFPLPFSPFTSERP